MTADVVHVAAGHEWRGGQRQVWLLARALARLGVRQIVVTTAGSELERRLLDTQVPVRAVRWRVPLDPAAIWASWRLTGPRTILHAHDAHAHTVADLAARLSGRPIVATRRVAFRIRHPAKWRRVGRAIAVSSEVARQLEIAGVPSDRVVTVPDGVDLAHVRSTRPGITRARLGLGAEIPLAVTVAALTAEKDHPTLVATAQLARRNHPDLHWAIAGEGPSRRGIEALIRAHGLTDRVHLLGWVPDPLEVIADASLMVATPTSEGLGSSILDALARGIPVVATAVGGIPDLLGRGAGLLVPARDPEAVATAVHRVLADAHLRATLVGQGLRIAESLTDETMARRVLTVYRSLSQQPEAQ